MLSPQGQELLVTGIPLQVGDRFLAPDNQFYQVVRVDRDVAYTRSLGRRTLTSSVPSLMAAGPARPPSPLALYHTHSDEAYLPTSGATNVPWNGDIFQVGRAMSLLWRRVGVPVLHSYRRHDPHDGEAYLRSRRTAVQLLRRRPAALFDVHRDTPPAWVYRRVVDGQRLASVLLVIGRQNPTMWANEAFAFSIKGYADGVYPALIRGILYAAADYNQDLHPRSLLVEVGSTYNSLDEALVGARFFAAVVPAVLFGVRVDPRMPPVPPQNRQAAPSRRGWQGVLAVLSVLVAGASLFVLANERAYEAAGRLGLRLRRLAGELARRLPGRGGGR